MAVESPGMAVWRWEGHVTPHAGITRFQWPQQPPALTNNSVQGVCTRGSIRRSYPISPPGRYLGVLGFGILDIESFEFLERLGNVRNGMRKNPGRNLRF